MDWLMLCLQLDDFDEYCDQEDYEEIEFVYFYL